MRSSISELLLLCLLAAFSAGTRALAASPERGRSFGAALSEAGLEYSGGRSFIIDKDYRRGDWKGARQAFWTLASSSGPVRLRLEMSKNISRDQAERTMSARFQRIDSLYSGAAAYPGLVTTEFEVPPQLRPEDLRTGPGQKKVKVLSATPSMAYGSGSEDLISYRGLLGYTYCESTALLAQIELFFPKAEFILEEALGEFDAIRCSVPRPVKGHRAAVEKTGK